jgi:hypothetical protein
MGVMGAWMIVTIKEARDRVSRPPNGFTVTEHFSFKSTLNITLVNKK